MPTTTSNRKPRNYVTCATESALDWDPKTVGLYSLIEGAPVRAGESYAIVRPGMERWPLGIVTERYRVTSHRTSIEAVKSFCSDVVMPGAIYMAAHGTHVAHTYDIRHIKAASVNGVEVTTRLVVENDHTGKGAMRSCMVVYVGNCALGSVVRTRGLHVGSQPEAWHSEISAMAEMAIEVQDALIDLLKAASARVFTDEDRKFLKNRKINIKGDHKSLLGALTSWMGGQHDYNAKITWGVWQRRLDDDAIKAMVALLGAAKYGNPIDQALRQRRYGTPTIVAVPAVAANNVAVAS